MSVSHREKQLLDYHLKIRSPLMVTTALVLSAVVSYVFISIDLSSYQRSLSADINRFGLISKYEFVLRQSTPGVVWLLLCVLYCIYKRLITSNAIPGTRHEPLMAESQRILNNSLEQFVIHIFTLLILVSYIDQEHLIVKTVLVLNALFIIGRVLFWLGYPKYRAVGYSLHFIPISFVLFYISYRYFV